MKLNKGLIITASIVIAVIVLGSFGFMTLSKPKIVYVNNQLLFDGFQMKKQLGQDLLKSQEKHTNLVDSLKGELMAMESAYPAVAPNKQEQFRKEFTAKQNYWLSLKQEYETKDKELEAAYTQQIWNQLNQYVRDYGIENGYDYIIGANGDGSLMYAKEAMDVTDYLIEYSNKRYEDKK